MSDNEQKKTITIKEFRMWLQGVEEMQGENWTPSDQQWQRIRAKINEIEEVSVNGPPPVQHHQAPVMTSFAPPVYDLPVMPSGPSRLTPGPAMPSVPQHTMTGSGMPVVVGPLGGQFSGKTPDVDTRGGSYQPAFL